MYSVSFLSFNINTMFKKLLVSLLLSTTVLSGVGMAMIAFNDVDSTTDYRDAIFWTVDHEITSGYGNGLWGPNECVRRAELMKMVMEYNGGIVLTITVPKTSQFSDVKTGDWFFDYVMQAKAAGYIEGYSDGTFQPNRCVNRAEAMKIAVNVLVGKGSLDSSGGPVMYDDKIVSDIAISDWFGPYARKLFKDRLIGTNHTRFSGSIAGTNTINFFPSGDMTRKEVAEMMYRIYQYRQARI